MKFFKKQKPTMATTTESRDEVAEWIAVATLTVAVANAADSEYITPGAVEGPAWEYLAAKHGLVQIGKVLTWRAGLDPVRAAKITPHMVDEVLAGNREQYCNLFRPVSLV